MQKSNSTRRWLLAGANALALATASQAYAQQRTFDIPAQPATRSIPELARQAGIQIVAPAERLRGVNTPPLVGEMDARAALRSLIAPTGLVIVSDDGATVVLAARSPAASETPTTLVDDVIVTSRRREESVQDVPLVVQAFSAQQIESRGIKTVDDVARLTPGLTFDRGISSQDTRPSIRGLPGTRGRQPVGILLDNIDISTEALGNAGGGSLVNLRLLDLERIEVVKGPQSALYGRAAFAGAINYISRRPSKEMQSEIKGSYASFNTYDLGATVSGPLIEDRLGFRLNLVHAKSDGDYTDPITGADLNAYKNTAGAAALEYDDGNGLNIYARLSYSDDQASQGAIDNLGGFAGETSRPLATTPEGQAVAIGFAGRALTSALTSFVPAAGDLKFEGVSGMSIDPTTGQGFPGSEGNTTIATVNVEKKFGAVALLYNGGYVRQKESLIYDGDFFARPLRAYPDGLAEPLNLFDVVNFDNELTISSHEFRIQDFESKPFRWAIGGLYWHSEMEQNNRSLRASIGFPATGTPAFAATAASTIYLRSAKKASPFGRDTKSLSVYALAEFDLTSKLTVSAEARYLDEEISVVRSDFVQAATVPLPAAFVNPVQRATVTDTAIVPRFSVSYDANPDLLFYGSASKGFKPAGVSELDFGSSLADSRYKAETVWNYEVGFKSTVLDRQLTLNGAVFYMDWSNKQVSQLVEDPAAPSGFRASIRNAGAAEVYGADLSLVFRPSAAPNLSMDVGYTFLDTQYTDFTIASNSGFTVTEARNCTVGRVGSATVCFVTYNGNRLERAPKHQVVANVDYRRDLTPTLRLLLGGSVQYRGARFLSEDNRMSLPSYVNLDLTAGVEFGRVMLQAFVNNATNDDTVRTAQQNFDLSNFGRAVNVYAPPRRSFGMRGKVGF